VPRSASDDDVRRCADLPFAGLSSPVALVLALRSPVLRPGRSPAGLPDVPFVRPPGRPAAG
jgi:hypothetical protein